MKTKCPVKPAFIIKMLDKFQPDWRDGADVTQETKQIIMRHLEEKYKPQLDELLEYDSISQRSIEKTIGKIRANLGFVAKSTRKTYPKRDRLNKKVPENKRIELYEMVRLLHRRYPYSCDEIIDACKNDADIIEIILKFHEKYPEEDIAVRESMQSYEIPLYNPYEVQAKQVRWVIPHTNKQLIIGRTGNISHQTISFHGCVYMRGNRKSLRTKRFSNVNQNRGRKAAETIKISKIDTDEPFAPGELEEEFRKEILISKTEQEEQELLDREYIERQSDKIMRTNPVKYILKVFRNQNRHVGDKHVVKLLLLSIASQSILNSKGIQVSAIGKSSGGKSECCKILLHFIPNEYKQKTELSDKAIWYIKDWKIGTVVYSNDIKLSTKMESVIKRATDEFQSGDDSYTVLTPKRENVKLPIPAKLTWWLTSVDASKNEQLLSRFMTVCIDESEEQDRRVHDHQLNSEDAPLPETTEVKICREIIRKIKKHKDFNVYLPKELMYCIKWNDSISDRRRFPLFKDMIRAFTVLRFKRRKTDDKGRLIANSNDIFDAIDLYNEICGTIKLTEDEIKVWRIIYDQTKINPRCNTSKEIARSLGKTTKSGAPTKGGAVNVRKLILKLLKKLPPDIIKDIPYIPPHGGLGYFYSSKFNPSSSIEKLIEWKFRFKDVTEE